MKLHLQNGGRGDFTSLWLQPPYLSRSSNPRNDFSGVWKSCKNGKEYGRPQCLVHRSLHTGPGGLTIFFSVRLFTKTKASVLSPVTAVRHDCCAYRYTFECCIELLQTGPFNSLFTIACLLLSGHNGRINYLPLAQRLSSPQVYGLQLSCSSLGCHKTSILNGNTVIKAGSKFSVDSPFWNNSSQTCSEFCPSCLSWPLSSLGRDLC